MGARPCGRFQSALGVIIANVRADDPDYQHGFFVFNDGRWTLHDPQALGQHAYEEHRRLIVDSLLTDIKRATELELRKRARDQAYLDGLRKRARELQSPSLCQRIVNFFSSKTP